MTAIRILFVLISITCAGFSLDPVPQFALDKAQTQIAGVNLGMTFAEVGKVLGEAWKFSHGAIWGRDRTAFYKNEKLPGYELKIGYQYSGHGVLFGITIDDRVTELPKLERK